MNITTESIRAAGGIVHSDGRIFFTNIEQVRAAVAGQPMKHVGYTCGDGDCGRIHDELDEESGCMKPVYVPATKERQ